MITIDLTGKTILLTGALGAIAEFVTKRLVEAGAVVLCTDIVPPDQARERIDSWGVPEDRTPYTVMDVMDPESVNTAVSELSRRYKQIEICLGHAGGCPLHPFHETSPEEYERIFRFNFHGQVYLTRAVTRYWLDAGIRGHMIYTSSLCGSVPWVDLSAYNPAKAALEMFARTLALEHAEAGIRYNLVAPGHVAAGSCLIVYENDPEYRSMVNRVIPLKRMVRPEAIGDAFVWLCSPLAEDVNGQVIKVDLGASIPKLGGEA
ncbi:MAG: SDR family oxidoreductase [Gammaproteobacteria bacterium]|nr:MAG: SDR family oxidoreductase [Gammaproteobacteria bacterium]